MSEERKTLENVIIDVLMMGSDRGALVRPAQQVGDNQCQDGICVLMMSDIALAIIGSAIRPIMAELGSSDDVVDLELHILKQPLKELFKVADSAPKKWRWFTFPFGEVVVTGVTFVGPICRRVAEIVTKCGAPCSLDPAKPAPGWKIVEKGEL